MIKIIILSASLFTASAVAENDISTTADMLPSNLQSRQNRSVLTSFKFDSSQLVNLKSDQLSLSKSIEVAQSLKADVVGGTRSAQDALLFKSISPSVVLIVTEDSLGSGSLIGNAGEILTNWHVVGKNQEVGVIFKPQKDTQSVSKADIRRAKVIKVDEVSDLALIQVIEVPANRKPIKLGDASEINIGADAHAIGHPKGEAWTYTKGVVSQYRTSYKWNGGEADKKHTADVIQTQTPINPGNSGGPLLTDAGTLIGVNSFKTNESEGLNFAVSIDDVRNFLSRNSSRFSNYAQAKPVAKTCEIKEISRGVTEDKSADFIAYDLSCTGKIDAVITKPYDTTKSITLSLDSNHDSRTDILIYSFNRDLKWNISLIDNNYDGQWDLVGYYTDGEDKPSRYETYAAFMAKAKN